MSNSPTYGREPSTTTPNRRLHPLIHRTTSGQTPCCARSLARYFASPPPPAAPRHIGAVDLLELAETLSPLATRLSLSAVQLAGACLSAPAHLCAPIGALRTVLRTFLFALLGEAGW